MQLLEGQDYALSTQKRFCDRLIIATLRPANFIVQMALQLEYERLGVPFPKDLCEERVGKDGNPFSLEKYPTAKPDSPHPLSSFTGKLRRLGLDELAQNNNIRTGTMSFVGHRPLEIADHEEMLDTAPSELSIRWIKNVLPTNPGEISTFGIRSHVARDADRGVIVRMEDDIKDVVDGSIIYDLRLCLSTIREARLAFTSRSN